ncbi:AAEL001671-PA [Aedes aegypti]|uniref:AAEL001671-PA n=1 Tax=Aedes aegypti TaxID=7159 RepID=Q17KK2_AEDAE|nr:AAEL001671-PA [Aedes aegypti]
MSVQRYKLIFILIFFIHTSTDAAAEASAAGDLHATAAVYHHQPQQHFQQQQQQQRQGGRSGPSNLGADNKGRTLFSPRLEYNEWHPVGRGDPLKNDPTYDYSPPVLERVRYWPENKANKDKTSDILLLGVPSKKASAKVEHQWTNNGPIRRNYYHQQINELPTVLMPPPLNNHLQPEEQYLWTQATTHQSQRYETPAEGFRYRPGPPAHPSQSFASQYSGQKYNEPPVHQATPYQQQLQAHSSQQYTTTIRLSTPNEFSSKKPILHTILQNEKAIPFTKSTKSGGITEYTSNFYNPQNINAMATTIIHPPQTTEYLITESSQTIPPVSTDIKAPHVTPAAFVPAMTSSTTTTTPPPVQPTPADPFLAHLQQAQPKAPLYLIIEGHSKVKTYGLNNNDTLMQLPKMVPVVGSSDPIIRHVVNRDETGDVLNIPRITMNPVMTSTMSPEAMSSSEETSEEKSAVNSLLSLLGSSFGDYFSDKDANGNSIDSAENGDKDSKSRRNARSVDDKQQLYVMGTFQVGDEGSKEVSGDYSPYRRGSVFDESASFNQEAFAY